MVFVNFPVALIIWVVFAIVYQQFENYVIQPQIQKRAAEIEPFIVLVSVLFGRTLFGCSAPCSRSRPRRRSRSLSAEYRDYRREVTAAEQEAGGPTPAPPEGPTPRPRGDLALGDGLGHLCVGDILERLLQDVTEGPLILLGERGDRGGGSAIRFVISVLSTPLLGEHQKLHPPVPLGRLAAHEPALLEAIDDAGDVRVVAEQGVGEVAHLLGTAARFATRSSAEGRARILRRWSPDAACC